MSITQNDFKKIWASTSSVPEYTFSDADYQDGWEFVGNLPPTRAMWDTLQRRNDQKMKYLQDNGSMCFDSVADMVATDLDEGQTVFTKGFHSVNDGGSAIYTIRAKDVSDVDDGGSIIFLDNGNVAELIPNGTTVNVKQFGAYGDGTHDDATAIQNALNKFSCVYVPVGTYNIGSTIDIPANKTLHLEGKVYSLLDKNIGNFPDTEYAIITSSTDHVLLTLDNASKIEGGLIYAPNITEVVSIDIGVKSIQNLHMNTAILGYDNLGGARSLQNTAIRLNGTTGTSGYICLSEFDNAIGGFYHAYFFDRPDNTNLPWVTFLNFRGIISDNYKGFAHNLGNYGYANGGGKYEFVVCGSNVWVNSASEAVLDLVGDHVVVDCSLSDIGASRKQKVGINMEHIAFSCLYNVDWANDRDKIINTRFGIVKCIPPYYGTYTVSNNGTDYGTLYYQVSGQMMTLLYVGTLPRGGLNLEDVPVQPPAGNFYAFYPKNTQVGMRMLQNLSRVTLINDSTDESSTFYLSLTVYTAN